MSEIKQKCKIQKNKKQNLKLSKQSIMSYMDKQFARFPHISEEIFDQLDNQNLVKCRRISKSWCNYLDDQKILYIRIIKQSIKSSNYIKAPPHSGYRGCLNSYSDACLDRNPYGLENGVDVRILEQIGTRKYAEMLVILRNADMMGKQSMKSSDFNNSFAHSGYKGRLDSYPVACTNCNPGSAGLGNEQYKVDWRTRQKEPVKPITEMEDKITIMLQEMAQLQEIEIQKPIIRPLVDLNTKPWREFFKRASADSLQFFARVSKQILCVLSECELQPFLMCGACNLALSALFESHKIREQKRIRGDADMMSMCGYATHMMGMLCYAGMWISSENQYLSCNLGCGVTPLHLIAMTGNLEIFKETYDKAKNKNPNAAEKGRTFLHFAIRFCSKEICMYILEKSYNEIRKNINGLSTLDMATLYITLDVSWMSLEIILGKIVEKDPGYRKVKPLQLAAIQGHLMTSEMILDKVVDKNPLRFIKKNHEELLDALKLF